MSSYRYVRFDRIPQGVPSLDCFSIAEAPVPTPESGEVLIKTYWFSVDPYMRGRMSGVRTYVEPFRVGEPLDGASAGRVIASAHPGYAEGDWVVSSSSGAWRELYLSDGTGLVKVRDDSLPVQTYLGVLGVPGFTAYAGLLRHGRPETGDTVFVSGAAGAVGSVVCQIARIKGCRVVASAGSAAKIDWLKNGLGVDEAFDYHESDNLKKTVRALCPDGIDVYFDNVGGAHLEAAIEVANPFARFAICGMIQDYNNTRPVPGPDNMTHIIGKRLKISGFIILDESDLYPEFVQQMGGWIRSGDIQWRETVIDGLENAPDAFLGLFRGDNIGKMLVRLA